MLVSRTRSPRPPTLVCTMSRTLWSVKSTSVEPAWLPWATAAAQEPAQDDDLPSPWLSRPGAALATTAGDAAIISVTAPAVQRHLCGVFIGRTSRMDGGRNLLRPRGKRQSTLAIGARC